MKIAIWGTGFYGMLLKEYFEKENEIVCFFDNNSSVECVDSVNVYKFDRHLRIKFDVLYVSNMSTKNVEAIKRQIGNVDIKVSYFLEDKILQEKIFIISKYNILKQLDWEGVILHIVTNDKFTKGYIDFMQKNLIEYKHVFFINRNGVAKEDIQNNVFEIINIKQFLHNSLVRGLLEGTNKIIISGAFDYEMIIQYPEALYKKTFIQFWGGDFYAFRTDPKRQQVMSRFSTVVDSCAGVLNLIFEDSTAIADILGLKHTIFYEVPMPSHDNFLEKIKPDNKERRKKENIITIGNSATDENNHVEVFDALKNLIHSNAKLCVPLSYGDDNYRDYVIDQGKKRLGNIFQPLTEFLPMDQYMKYLADCEVGIFNNDRQQALGNIIALLYLGKKVYLRQDTSMAKFFKRIGVKTFDITTLYNNSLDNILYMADDERESNMQIVVNYYSTENVEKKWRDVLDIKI